MAGRCEHLALVTKLVHAGGPLTWAIIGSVRDNGESRQWPRLAISFPVFARGVDLDGREFKELATAYNISAGGMLVAVSRRLVPALRLRLDIPAPPNIPNTRTASVREIEAHVIRVEQRPRHKLLGLKFESPIA
jgi:hypothetical protein